ncbi:MAG: FMN-dependent NADH-azoreductase [Candidatus Izemoplasmatales bacterium]
MAKVLYIKADAKFDQDSRTFKISDAFINEYKLSNPNDEIIMLDLYEENIGFLPKGQLGELHTPTPGAGKDHPILKYAYQFKEADKYVIAAPFWNLSFPAILKAYIDYITVSGITFAYTAQGPVGLINGDKAVYFVSRGGNYLAEPFSNLEMGERYLNVLLRFLGVKEFNTISADGLDIIGVDVEGIMSEAIQKAKDLAKKF